MARLIVGANESTLYLDDGQTIVKSTDEIVNNDICKYKIREKFMQTNYLCRTSCGYQHAHWKPGLKVYKASLSDIIHQH